MSRQEAGEGVTFKAHGIRVGELGHSWLWESASHLQQFSLALPVALWLG